MLKHFFDGFDELQRAGFAEAGAPPPPELGAIRIVLLFLAVAFVLWRIACCSL